jgi:thiol-disulfide isomerase/thioredoxin
MLAKSWAYARLSIGFAGMIFPISMVRAANPPRYALTPGERLIYKTNNVPTGTTLNATSEQTIEITVLRLNPDDSWHLFEQDTTHDAAASSKKPVSGASTEVKVLDVFPDGHLPATDDAEDAESSAVFPSLPPSALAMQSTWKTQTNPIEEQDYEVLQNNGKEFIESTQSSGLMDQVYLQKSSAKIHFDRSQGIVTAIDATDSGDYTNPFKSSATTRLISVEKISIAALQQLSADADLMNQVEKQDQNSWMQAQKEKRNELKVGEQNKALLLAAASRVKTESIKTHLTTMAQEVAEYAVDDAKDEAQQANLIGKPSANWQTTDLDGHKQSLEAYRGKVLLLDFWFRGCEPCMMAMPQVKQIAEEYKNKGVVTLACPMDEEANAKFVGKIFGLPYPIVCSAEIFMAYGVHEFPTLMIIDQKGIVRDLEVGYRKDLKERIEGKVDALLRRTDSQQDHPRSPKALPASAVSIQEEISE